MQREFANSFGQTCSYTKYQIHIYIFFLIMFHTNDYFQQCNFFVFIQSNKVFILKDVIRKTIKSIKK